MSVPQKKPLTPGGAAGRLSPNKTSSSGAPSPSPSRMAANCTTPAPGSSGVRISSVRAGTPVSARAAARRPIAGGSTSSDGADEDSKAEMSAVIQDLQLRLQQAEQSLEGSQKSATVLQLKLDDGLRDQNILEETLHEHTEKIEAMETERKDALRARRELESVFETERAAAMRKNQAVQQREDEMASTIQRLKETLQQRGLKAGVDDERRPSLSRNSSFRNSANPSPNPEAQFAPPSSLNRSDSRSNSKLVMQKDKIIESLRLELAEAQIKLVEVENIGGGRLHELEKSLYETKMQNGRLMEENESFHLLLSEKTLNGDFANSDLLRPPSTSGSRPPSRDTLHKKGNSSLADELKDVTEDDILADAQVTDNATRRLQAEVNSLKDQNKALTLYINNIISRLLQTDLAEQILDKSGTGMLKARSLVMNKDKDIPPPPPEKDAPAQAGSFLQRARSVVGGRPKPRPLSQIPAQTAPSALPTALNESAPLNEDVEQVSRVPLGRSRSTRGANSGHKRSKSEFASVVGQMYKGPPPGPSGPVSPSLTSPRQNSFFGPSALTANGSRFHSGSNVPAITEAEKENMTARRQQRDSELSSSSRNSDISNPTYSDPDASGNNTSEFSIPSSPPRSTTSSGDREKPSGGAIMMGTKMRPLRLVQNAAEEDAAAKKATKHGSWFGWMNKGGIAPRTASGDGA